MHVRSIKRALLVAAVLGSVTSAGAGMAQAGGHDGHDAPDVTVNNVQPQNCNYNSLIPIQIPIGAGILGHGSSTAVGQSCSQSGPSFGK
jgi:hypothetical protein